MIDTGDSTDGIIHFGAIRLRIVGSGNIIPTFYSLDDVESQALVPIAMNATTAREPTRLANFKSQKAYLKLETTEIDEVFNLNRVVVFVKALYSQYPG